MEAKLIWSIVHNWRFVLGIGLLGGFVGVPVVRMVVFVASVSGWPKAIEGVIVSALWGTGIGLGVWLLLKAIGRAVETSSTDEE